MLADLSMRFPLCNSWQIFTKKSKILKLFLASESTRIRISRAQVGANPQQAESKTAERGAPSSPCETLGARKAAVRTWHRGHSRVFRQRRDPLREPKIVRDGCHSSDVLSVQSTYFIQSRKLLFACA